MTIDQLSGVRRRKSLFASRAILNVFDIVVAGAALVVLSPVMLAIMVAVWFDSGRPIFFSQVRLGRHGRLFRMHKFRKFGPKEGTDGCGVTVNGDARLTRLGAFLERAKLDELPQLWNVLKGDMAIVGPRPESTNFADCFNGPYRQVLDYKPGIFGPCQVLFRNEGAMYPPNTDPEQYYRDVLFKKKARIDIDYFARRTLWSDVQCLAQGVFGVFGLSWGSPPGSIQDAGHAVTTSAVAPSLPPAVSALAPVADGMMWERGEARRSLRSQNGAAPGRGGKRERVLRGAKARASMVKPASFGQAPPTGTQAIEGIEENGAAGNPARTAGPISSGAVSHLQHKLAAMDKLLRVIEHQLAVKDKQIKELTETQRDIQLMLKGEFKYVFPAPAERPQVSVETQSNPLKATDDVVITHATSL